MDAMINPRFAAMGVAAILLGGCAAQPGSVPAASPKANTPIQSTPDVKWQATAPPPVEPSAAEMLAQKTKDYADAMNGAEATNPGDPFPGNSPGRTLVGPSGHRSKVRPLPSEPGPSVTENVGSPAGGSGTGGSGTGAPGTGVPPTGIPQAAVPPGKPAVDPGSLPQVAGARVSPNDGTFAGPRIAAESEDFVAPGSGNDALAQRLLKRARENPRDISNQLDLQLYGMLNDDQTPELGMLSAMPADDRELVSALVDGLSNFRSTVRQDANMLPAQKMRPLQDMVERLRSQADLTVSTVAICKRVDAFGKYEPITPARFPAMKENLMIVYCELENFIPKQNDRQLWDIRLSEQTSLYTDSGLLVWSDKKQSVTDECRNRRHDFYCFNKISLPASLPIGRYTLKVSIEDENTDPSRVAESSVPVIIAAQ
jgi:hypothetical protein